VSQLYVPPRTVAGIVLSNSQGNIYLGLKEPERVANNSPPSNAGDKDCLRHISLSWSLITGN
jgi:hypothetical protein